MPVLVAIIPLGPRSLAESMMTVASRPLRFAAQVLRSTGVGGWRGGLCGLRSAPLARQTVHAASAHTVYRHRSPAACTATQRTFPDRREHAEPGEPCAVVALAPPSARDAALAIVEDREPLVDVAVDRGELPGGTCPPPNWPPGGRATGGWIPRSPLDHSFREAPSYIPVASPRLRRRPSPWPPARPLQPGPELTIQLPKKVDGCALQTDAPGGSREADRLEVRLEDRFQD